MNDSVRSTVTLIAVCAAAWGAWVGWETWKTRQALDSIANVVRSTDLDRLLSDPPAEVLNSVDLAIRGIRLQQGENARKTFELRADWATLNQKSGNITVRDPDIRYMMAGSPTEAGRVVHSTSRIGRIEEGNRKVSMSDDVKAVCEDKTLTSDSAVFLNEERTLTFTSGARLDSPDLSGKAGKLVWHLNSNTLRGSGGVTMRWTPSQPDEVPAAPDDAADSPTDTLPGSRQEAEQR
ncbi:MAG: hypothetical protein MJ061_00725 [Mailhella sp.]|nr:hypothetical protein [Mailhella sp.]